MKRIGFAFLLVLLAAFVVPTGVGVAGEQAKTAEKTAGAVDAAKLERFLRRFYGWPDTVQVSIGPFKPSPVAGLLETTVYLSQGGQKQEATFLVSADGQYLIPGTTLALNTDPFAVNRAKIELKDVPSIGSPLAPVAIVEYSDFQCTFCRGMSTVLREQVPKEFPQEVRVFYKDYPIPQIHPWAVPASALGRCIFKRYKTDAFWPYHDWVFANQPQLTTENFKGKALAFAKEKGLDTAQLGACMEQPEIKAEVDRDVAEGLSLGVSGTPTLFINGRRVVGNQPFAQLRQVIQAELDYVKGK